MFSLLGERSSLHLSIDVMCELRVSSGSTSQITQAITEVVFAVYLRLSRLGDLQCSPRIILPTTQLRGLFWLLRLEYKRRSLAIRFFTNRKVTTMARKISAGRNTHIARTFP